MKTSSLYTVAYATVLGTVCAALLCAAGWMTDDRIARNREAEEVFHILTVLGAPVDDDTPAGELLAVFEERVRTETHGDLTLYLYTADGAVAAVAVPVAGPGLWGPIRGFLSLEPDRRTVRGVTFHEQEETPGLGGEIASTWFTDQFKGKTIVHGDRPGIRIVRGGARAPNEVDAITGATMTSSAVEQMLNAAIDQLVREGSPDVR